MAKAKPEKKRAIKTQWDLGLLYKSHDDPQIDGDLLASERGFKAFAKKYQGKPGYLKGEAALHRALTDYEGLYAKLPLLNPYLYFHFAQDIDSADEAARARMTQVHERIMKTQNLCAFFELSLAKIPQARQKRLLASKRLAHFRYFLETIFKRAAHDLSEAEEKIMSLKSIPAHAEWVNMTKKMLGQRTVEWKGKTIGAAEAGQLISDLPLPDRRELHAEYIKAIGGLADVAESEMNAIVLNKKIGDELRGFEMPYDSTILSYQNDRKSVMALVRACTDNFPISHRFYRLKAKLLKLKRLEYSDRAVGIGSDAQRISFVEAAELLRGIFAMADPRYAAILDRYLENGQIDAYPKIGKKNGAYCWGHLNMPTFVLLNFSGTLDQVSTFAHEMGHAIHTELSKSQSHLYQDYSTSTAEVASTFFEAMAFDHVLESLPEKDRIPMLCARINDDIQTIFRQIACFNFEAELHATIRAKGGMTKKEIARLMNKHMQAYLGPIFDIKDEDGDMFVSWGHIRNFFYVYSYAFGQLISKALYERYKEDKGFIEKVNQFLSAGGSDTPENIFKSIGIDVTKPDFWELGLKSIEKDIERLEKLTKKG